MISKGVYSRVVAQKSRVGHNDMRNDHSRISGTHRLSMILEVSIHRERLEICRTSEARRGIACSLALHVAVHESVIQPSVPRVFGASAKRY